MKYKKVLQTFSLTLLYGISFYVLQFFLYKIGWLQILPDSKNLLYWDAGVYSEIADIGYVYKDYEGSNSAFYFLFPLVWRLLHVGVWGICFVNLLFLATAFTLFTSMYPLLTSRKLVWLSIPSMMFAFIPYSEALFILLITLVFYGIVKDKKAVIWISLFLVSLVRPVSMVLIPAFLITEVLAHEQKNLLRAIKNYFIIYAWPLIMGQAFFVWYQHYAVGVWFAFFKQEKFWGHILTMPALPFNSMNGPRAIWLNAIAMFVGFLSFLLLVSYGLKWLRKRNIATDKVFTVSLLYLTATTLITILFNPKWQTNTTNVYDIHRYALATPFFWVFLYRFTETVTYKPKDYVFVLLLSNLFWLFFGSYAHIAYLIYFNFGTAFLLLFMGLTQKKNEWVPMILFAINVLVQLYLFQSFLMHWPVG